MTRLFLGLGMLVASSFLTLSTSAADPPDSPGAKATREKKLKAKLDLDIDKKMLRDLINSELPLAVKDKTSLTLKIVLEPGAGVTLTSSFGPFKGEMTLEEVLNKICEDKSWGWYVNSTKVGDQKDGAIILTTNPKQRGYKEGSGLDAKKDEPKSKTKPKEKSKD
ncbi:MAG TPA: hypothetical protein VM597_24270 [Gemmataceae bacterium]|nr:hypothetical protein [Gemmataceae bacterium]